MYFIDKQGLIKKIPKSCMNDAKQYFLYIMREKYNVMF